MNEAFVQKDQGFLTYPSNGWRRAMFRWPVQLWRLGLGPVIGRFMVLISHTGRKSGLTRRTMTELHVVNGKKYAPSGFGRRAQWYRNIEADPRVTIQTADGAESAIARRVTDDDELLAACAGRPVPREETLHGLLALRYRGAVLGRGAATPGIDGNFAFFI